MAKSVFWSQPNRACISFAENKTKGTHKQKQLKSAAVKVWPSITKEETQSMARSMISRLRQSLSAKDSIYAKQNIKYEHCIYDYIYLSNHIWALEKEGCVKKLLSILCYIVQPPELKLKVCTSITSWFVLFQVHWFIEAKSQKLSQCLNISRPDCIYNPNSGNVGTFFTFE